MYRTAFFLFALLTSAPSLLAAQSPVTLESEDVFFQFIPAHRSPTANVSGVCGFSIRGNHRSRANPRPEWDINIDEISAGDRHVAGISAGAFEVDGQKRIPKPPIVSIVFAIEHDPEQIPAQIVGSPNSDNAIKAMLDTEPANRLFTAFSDANVIIINLEYAGGASDHLLIRGWHDSARGKNSQFAECMRGFTPSGPLRRIP